VVDLPPASPLRGVAEPNRPWRQQDVTDLVVPEPVRVVEQVGVAVELPHSVAFGDQHVSG
jgi:hypothetical protein